MVILLCLRTVAESHKVLIQCSVESQWSILHFVLQLTIWQVDENVTWLVGKIKAYIVIGYVVLFLLICH